MQAIPGEFQHALLVADIDKRKLRNVVRKMHIERRKITLLKDLKIRKWFQEVIELVDIVVPNVCWRFKDGVLEACNKVCEKMTGRRSEEDTWWWNDEVKEAVSKMKYAH